MNSFKEQILTHYLDSELLVSRDRNPSHWSTGNGALFTGVFYTLLYLRGECTPEDVERFNMAITPLWKDDENGMPIPGLLERNDKRPDFEAHDDYRGVCAASFFLNTNHSKEIVNYGQRNFWCFDNVSPGRFSARAWHGRFPGLIGYYRLSGRKSPGPLQAFLLGTNIAANAENEDADSKVLGWLSVLVAKYSGQLNCSDAIQYWENKLAFKHGGMPSIFARSYGVDHPFVNASAALGPFGTGDFR